MKKFAVLLTVFALLASAPAHAQNGMGRGAAAGKMTASDEFAWAPFLGGLAVFATMFGIAVAAATNSPSTFSH